MDNDKRLSFTEYCSIVRSVGIRWDNRNFVSTNHTFFRLSDEDLQSIMAAKDINEDGYDG